MDYGAGVCPFAQLVEQARAAFNNRSNAAPLIGGAGRAEGGMACSAEKCRVMWPTKASFFFAASFTAG
jgi:hypothetical protein